MNRLLKPLKKLSDLFKQLRISLDKNKFDSVNLYFQDESRFGLMTHTGRCLTAKAIKPIVTYQHAFKNTYVYGSFSPINGDAFIWEIDGVDLIIFEKYLQDFSQQNPKELKLLIVDNAGFHSTKNITIPENIILINIPPYSPELNPAEKIWHFMKQKYKNKVFGSMDNVRTWLHDFINTELYAKRIISITNNKFY
ncbi:MAG: IS630 family transposase, partial [Herbaspirillum sp.]|nr:IS630 family transposase [Herbaspirillum sp.]